MKFTIVCLFAAVAVVMGETYTDKYDDINYQEIIKTERLLKAYIECLLEAGNGKCTADGKELKSHVKDALETNCSKCTPKQQEGTKVIISHLINNKPNEWAKLTAKFDPSGTYAKKYESEYRKIKA